MTTPDLWRSLTHANPTCTTQRKHLNTNYHIFDEQAYTSLRHFYRDLRLFLNFPGMF